ncbi:protein FAM178B [Sorex fumeus]|uniref:protein FAM178B n=1 Tax=Sorex fumeus TaxID=62283 RepID=UPI0024ADF273|nr:protein FAM178B [Sorex fumeus]
MAGVLLQTALVTSCLQDAFLPVDVHTGLIRPTRRLCSPTSATASKLPKKPKMQATGDVFPTDWSPPPIEFLNPPAKGAAGPQDLRRLAHQLPEKLASKQQTSDPKRSLDSLEELFLNLACPNQKAAALPEFTSGSSESYVNSLDYLLQEKREQAPEQEREKLLLQECPDINSLDLEEDEVSLTHEHRLLLERFSVSLQAIPTVHPGETVFLPRQHPQSCILDCSHLEPQNPLEGLFFRSPPAQQLSYLCNGLLSTIYLDTPHHPLPLLQWLFQLLTWPPETSSRAFDLLWDLSVDELFRHTEGDLNLWHPSLQEIVEAFHNLGAHDVHLFPQEPDQECGRGQKSKTSPSQPEPLDPSQEIALDTSLSFIYKILTLCALGQPGAYPDSDLLGLIELLCRVSLDTGLRLLPKTDLQQLLLLLLQNIQDWPGKLQQLCQTLSSVSDHHHNLMALVQFFLDVTSRSRQLRGQLSLLIIARMLNQQDTLPVWQEKAQLSSLSRLLSLMRPSSLRQHLGAETVQPCQEPQPRANAELDHKACYLCHSLLTLAGVVVSCQDITAEQWAELQLLCMQLDRHISTHIRESPQAMHRTKLKDLAAQTYIRWQELLALCQPQAQYFSPWKET